MQDALVTSFDPFNDHFPGMDMDDEAQAAIEGVELEDVADHQIVEYGRTLLCRMARPTEKGVLATLKASELTQEQIETHFRRILVAAGPRFAHILGGLRNADAN